MDKPIVSLWGFGPSYRKRVKLNILDAIEMGYDNMMDYVVLTDMPEDFTEFAEQTGKIKAIVNIHEARQEYEWSKELEFIPAVTTDPKQYGDEYMESLSKGKLFSYSLHRFSFPTIAKLGYNKVVFMDGDVKLRYDKIVSGELTEEQFWAEFDSPVNSMKGCVYELLGIRQDTFNQQKGTFDFVWSMAMGMGQSFGALQACSIVLHELYKADNVVKPQVITELPLTEGPFRYYHFESPEKVQKYFETWNEVIRLFHSNTFLRQHQQCGGYMTCDYMPVATTNVYQQMKVLNFPNTVYNRQIHFTDRYFLPLNGGAPGLGTKFIPGDSEEDFIEKNKDLKQILEDRNAWPHTEPY
jgi:hypothetical protein